MSLLRRLGHASPARIAGGAVWLVLAALIALRIAFPFTPAPAGPPPAIEARR